MEIKTLNRLIKIDRKLTFTHSIVNYKKVNQSARKSLVKTLKQNKVP